MKEAFDKARRGEGPSLIDCLTYRHSGHSRTDPAKYRPEGEPERWKQKDPVKIYRERLKQFGIKQDQIEDIEADVRSEVDERSDEHTSELQSLMRISYAVFCLKKK